MRRAAKVDRNHGEIVKALRAAGAGVCDLSAVGSGCPDLLASYRGQWFLLEVKDGKKPPSKRQLTPDQQAWHALHRAPVAVVKDVDEALAAIGATGGTGRWALDNIS